MSTVQVSTDKKRGEYLETIVRDTTRVAHPIVAKVYALDDDYLIVPESDLYPVVLRDSFSSAVAFCERLIT